MKKFTFLTIVLALFGWSNVANAQWTSLNVGTPNYFNSICFGDANTGYAVGDFGYILKTSDGGNTWNQQSGTGGAGFNSVYFVNANTGWAVGSSGTIIYTNNGGANWSFQSSGTTEILYSVYFVDVNTGYAVGSKTILKTTNAGTNWIAQTTGLTNFGLFSVYFTSADSGCGVGGTPTGGNSIFTTTNGGASWSHQTTSLANWFSSVCFTDNNTGYIVGGTGPVLKTTDAGVNWVALPASGNLTGSLKSIFFINDSIGYAVGSGGKIIKTINACVSWTQETSGITNNLNSVYFTDVNTGFAVGGNPYPSLGIILSTGVSAGIAETNFYNTEPVIYPNPSYGKFAIDFFAKINSIEIYSVIGAKILQQQTSSEIDLSNSPKGIYFVKVTDGEKTYTSKIVVE